MFFSSSLHISLELRTSVRNVAVKLHSSCRFDEDLARGMNLSWEHGLVADTNDGNHYMKYSIFSCCFIRRRHWCVRVITSLHRRALSVLSQLAEVALYEYGLWHVIPVNTCQWRQLNRLLGFLRAAYAPLFGFEGNFKPSGTEFDLSTAIGCAALPFFDPCICLVSYSCTGEDCFWYCNALFAVQACLKSSSPRQYPWYKHGSKSLSLVKPQTRIVRNCFLTLISKGRKRFVGAKSIVIGAAEGSEFV